MYKTALSVLLTGASAASAALQVDFESSSEQNNGETPE
jgi:hypothetical protein